MVFTTTSLRRPARRRKRRNSSPHASCLERGSTFDAGNPRNFFLYRHPYIEDIGILRLQGWSSDFPPLQNAFSSKQTMASWFWSPNGVHSCGTVEDFHFDSQLIAAKRTFTGNIFHITGAKIKKFDDSHHFLGIFLLMSINLALFYWKKRAKSANAGCQSKAIRLMHVFNLSCGR